MLGSVGVAAIPVREFGYWVVTWLAAVPLATAGHAQQLGRNAIAASLIPKSADFSLYRSRRALPR